MIFRLNALNVCGDLKGFLQKFARCFEHHFMSFRVSSTKLNAVTRTFSLKIREFGEVIIYELMLNFSLSMVQVKKFLKQNGYEGVRSIFFFTSRHKTLYASEPASVGTYTDDFFVS